MLYSDQGNFKLHVAANNALPHIPGAPKRVALTVNHIEYYDSTPYGSYERPPTEDQIRRSSDLRIAGDKRSWRVSHIQQQMKPFTKVPRAMVTSFFVILEQVILNPEKEIESVTPELEPRHLRRFSNLIMEDEI